MLNTDRKKILNLLIWLYRNVYRFLVISIVELSKKKTSNFPQTKVGISMLLCHKDVHLALLCLSTLTYFSETRFPIFILDDGSLTKLDCELLKKFFDCNIMYRKEANIFEKDIKKTSPYFYKLLKLKSAHAYKYKLELLFLSPFKKFIILDADILFFSKPKEVLRWINSKKFSFIYTDLGLECYRHMQKEIHNVFLVKKLLYKNINKSKKFSNVVSAVVGIPNKHRITIRNIEKFLKKTSDLNMLNFIYLEEMVIWDLMASYPNSRISPEKYYTYIWQIHKFTTKNRVMIHFLGNTKVKMVFHGLCLLLKITLK